MKIAKVLVVQALALTLLSGCTSGQVAAKVGDATVSTDQVELLARVQCELSKGQVTAQGPSITPRKVLRAQAANALVDLEIFTQLGDLRGQGYDLAAYKTQMADVRGRLEGVSEADRGPATELLSNYWKGVLRLQQIAENGLHDLGVAKPTQEELDAAVQKTYTDFRNSLDIEVNPSYSPDEKDIAGSGDGSVSLPVSAYARQATAASPDAGWVAGLPVNQRCG